MYGIQRDVPMIVAPKQVVQPKNANVVIVEATDCERTTYFTQWVDSNAATRRATHESRVIPSASWKVIPNAAPNPFLAIINICLTKILHTRRKLMRHSSVLCSPLA